MTNEILTNAKKRKIMILKELEELNIVIDYLEKNINSLLSDIKPTQKNEKKYPQKTESKTSMAARLCKELIGKTKVTSSRQFMAYIKENGVNISHASLIVALKKAKLGFNKKTNYWVLKK